MARVVTIRGKRYLEWWDPRRKHTCRSRWHGTLRAGEKAAREKQVAVDSARAGLDTQPQLSNDVEVKPLISAWHAYLIGRRSPKTWDSYRIGLVDVLGWLEANGRRVRLVSDLTLGHAEAFKAAALGRGLAPRTVQMRVGAVIALLNWASGPKSAEGNGRPRIAFNPLSAWQPLTGAKRRDRTPWTAFELQQIVEASRVLANDLAAELGESPAGRNAQRLRVARELGDAWVFLAQTGLRAGEMSGLEWADVDVDARTLRVRGETSKSRRTRYVPMSRTVAAIVGRLRLHLVERPEAVDARRYLWVNVAGKPWERTLSRRLKPALAVAGLRKTADLHTFRHTFASQAVKRGADPKALCELMGHSSITVTIDIYGHLFDGQTRAVVDSLDDLGSVSSVSDARNARRTRAGGA